MIATLQVYFGKDSRATEAIEHVIKLRDRKLVVNGDLVDGLAIYAHPPHTIFLKDQ